MAFDFGGGKKGRAGFMSASPQQRDPLADVQYTGNLEEDAAAELSALEQGMRERNAAEAKRFQQATDSEFWFAVCFRSRAHKEAFLEGIRAAQLGDKYLDGHALARLLGVTLPD